MRDKLREMFPGEHIKGDLDDPAADREGETECSRGEREGSSNSDDSQATIPVK